MSVPGPLIDAASLSAAVGRPAYESGLALYRKQQVQDCTLAAVNRSEWAVQGTVLDGREQHETSATLEVSPDGKITFFSGQCSCTLGQPCRHSIAATLKAAYKAALLKSRPVPAYAAADTAAVLPVLAAEPAASVVLPNKTARPLQAMTSALDLFGNELPVATGPAAATGSSSTNSAASAEVLVFTLSRTLLGQHPALRLDFGLSRRLASGRWARLKAQHHGDGQHLNAQDLETVSAIKALAGQQGLLAGDQGLYALRLATQSGRLLFCPEERVLGMPLQLGPARPLRFAWVEVNAFRQNELEPGQANALRWQLQALPGYHLSGAELFANIPPLYVMPNAGQCGLLMLPDNSQASSLELQQMLTASPVAPADLTQDCHARMSQLAGLPLPAVQTLPELLQGITPRPHLHISPVAARQVEQLGLLRATLRFHYGRLAHYALEALNPVLIEEHGESAQGPQAPVRRSLLHRDLAAEKAAHVSLHALGLAGDARGQFNLPFISRSQQQQWLHWLDNGFADLKNAGFDISTAPELASWISRADTLEVQLQPVASAGFENIRDRLDSAAAWFDLSLGMQVGGQRRNILPLLPELLAQLAEVTASKTGQEVGQADIGLAQESATLQLPDFVYLQQDCGQAGCPGCADGQSQHYLRLPTAPLRPWLQALLELVGERGKPADGNTTALRLSRMQALRLGGALGAGAQWQGADSLREMVSQLAGGSALPEVPPPAGLAAQLRPYQQQGLNWLQFLRSHALGGILADDMGLGKTLQTLAHILTEKNAGRLDLPVLIIAPVSLMGNWRREASRFTPGLRTLVLHGNKRHGSAGDLARHDVVLAPYSLLQRDRERWLGQAWHLVVLDEAQNIKNTSSQAAQVVGEINTRHRLCLSGTPMENHLGELWSLFHFLMPGFLGSQARFKAFYRTPIEKHGHSESAEQLRRRVRPFMLRRHKKDVAQDLPDKQIAVSSVELGDQQADLYETIRLTTEKTVRDALANKGLAKSQIQILDALLKLRQVCCDPRLVNVNAARQVSQSAKLDWLMDMLPELLAEGRKVLLFSQFTSMLALIEDELKKRAIRWVKLTGQSQNRDQIIEQFTSGQVPLFLISLKAGGVGLNLTQADTVIHYDPWWNPAAENQATDRAHRIGQTRQVMVYKLVAQGTIEERILALQERKAALAETVYSGSGERAQGLLTESDLDALLLPLGG